MDDDDLHVLEIREDPTDSGLFVLFVAGERSHEVASLGIDLRTGVPGRVRHRTAAPSPTCLLAAR